ncbi:hypothetical protein CPB85DRAFT_1293842 [Mucidula mucida]|nr:hypothetical protein CPB85DRAFT_1293842 [Mucidula mucida]
MFPDFDDMLLSSVLDSVHGNQDRAVDALLGMSDPEYKSEAPPVQAERPMTQEELDEQLARRLLMEDEQLQHNQWQQQQQQGGWGPQAPAPALNRRPSQQGQEKDTMTEIGEQFNKIAESGKRTFGNIFNKVKAKMAEMDQPRNTQNTASSSSQPPPWGVGGDTYPYDSHAPGSQPQQAPYYNPNPSPPPVAITNRPMSSSPVQGYDLSPSATEDSAGTPRPPSTGQGQPIDGGKLGLLPKRPVSLLRTSPPPVEQPTPQKKKTADSEELEYVENPFEDGRK